MEIAQQLLKNVQEVGMPMLEEFQEILKRVRGISVKVESGSGVVGRLISDNDMGANISKTVAAVEGLVSDARNTVKETTRLIKGFQNHWLLRRYVPREDKKQVFELGTYLTAKEKMLCSLY